MSDYNVEDLDDHRGMGELLDSRPLDLDNRNTRRDNKFGMSDRSYNVLLHVSQYFSIVIPFAGIIAPLFLWLRLKDEDAEVDEHGKAILNWNITVLFIYLACMPLFFILIGFLLIWIPIILSIVFPVIGAIKANDGKLWKYPLSYNFFK